MDVRTGIRNYDLPDAGRDGRRVAGNADEGHMTKSTMFDPRLETDQDRSDR
jgi:hypothetical protein